MVNCEVGARLVFVLDCMGLEVIRGDAGGKTAVLLASVVGMASAVWLGSKASHGNEIIF
jgi:hypothetical protein